MDEYLHHSFDASDRSYFAVIKKEIQILSAGAGFSEHRLGEINLITAEMLSNLAKYARGGELLVKLLDVTDTKGIEIISLDRGPGMTDVPKMSGDGYSSSQTLGHGLGSIKRLSDECHIYSQKDWGTVIVSRVYVQPPSVAPAIAVRGLLLPKKGETACGDRYYVKQTKDHVKVLLGDGLGHGAEAALAVSKAVEAFKMCPDNDPCNIIRYIDEYVRKTRGLVATVAVLDRKRKEWNICGVGNIATRIFSPVNQKNHFSYNGIVGMNVPRTMNSQVIEQERNQHLIMCSDGIRSKWEVTNWPGILRHDLSVFCAAVYKDFNRGTDDTSVLICKIN